ncbi:MAG: hypothetical protein SWE60_13230 [Thermodesulfobacteriota bacterium]|nr:hypothetical protein [Thermodesulfobacteriota bacterium]
MALHFCEAASGQKPKVWPLNSKGQTVIRVQGGLEMNRLPVDGEQLLSRQIPYPVLILAEEDFCVAAKDSRVVQNETTAWVFADGHRKFFE